MLEVNHDGYRRGHSKIEPGMRFGRWTALQPVGNGKWLCECECGTRKAVAYSSLEKGKSQSCGCLRREISSKKVDIEGMRFGRWTVKSYASNGKWLCVSGNFSTQESDGDLDVIVELPDGIYTKHYFGLNEWTTYVVEDLSGTGVTPYAYELNFLPESVPGVTITSSH